MAAPISLCLPASSARADDDPIEAVAQKEIDRVKALDPARLVIKPPAVLCESIDGFQEAIVAELQNDREHLEAIPGCNTLVKGTRIAVLDFPNVLTAHVRMILPTGINSPLNGTAYFMLPADIADQATVPASRLLASPAPKKRTQ